MQARDIERGFARAEASTETRREVIGETHRKRSSARSVLDRAELGFDRFAPATQQRLHLLLKLRLVGSGVAIADVEHEADRRQIAALDFEAPVEQARRCRVLEQCLDFHAHLRRDHVARQPYEGEQVACQRCLDQRQPRARAIDQAHHGGRDAFDIAFGKADQQIVRKRGQCVDQRLACMARVVEAMTRPQRIELVAQAGHLPRGRCQRRAGPNARMDRQRDRRPLLGDRHDEQV